MLNNDNLSKKTIILGAITFWLLGYSVILIIYFLKINFYVVWPQDTFLNLFIRPFFAILFLYSPFYILPFLFAATRSIMKLIISISLSVILFLPTFFIVIGTDWVPEYRKMPIFILIGIQILFCLILSVIFNYKKEKIIAKLILISLIFFLVTVSYITISAKVASDTGPVLEKLSQEAIKTGDVSLCEKILEESKKKKVYAENRGSLCQNYHRECIQQIAIETNNIEICKKIFGGAAWVEKIECVGTIAANTNNPNLCIEAEEMIRYPLSGKSGIPECLEVATPVK